MLHCRMEDLANTIWSFASVGLHAANIVVHIMIITFEWDVKHFYHSICYHYKCPNSSGIMVIITIITNTMLI